jgi:hypothetical protein
MVNFKIIVFSILSLSLINCGQNESKKQSIWLLALVGKPTMVTNISQDISEIELELEQQLEDELDAELDLERDQDFESELDLELALET